MIHLRPRSLLSAAVRLRANTANIATRLFSSATVAGTNADALQLDAHAFAHWRDTLDGAQSDTLASLMPGGAHGGGRGGAFIGGEWVGASDGATFAVFDPATGEHLAEVPDATADDARDAVGAAHAAGAGWAAAPAKERGGVLRRWHELMLEHQELIARVMTAECGKPLAEARGEVLYATAFLEWFSEEAKRGYGSVIPPNVPGRRLVTVRQPVGVCALVTPWNFPAAMITRKVAPALAVGCTAVVKPAEDTPLTALVMAELAGRAGVPSGVLNVLPASRDRTPAVGNALCDDPRVRKLSFTGSTAVGKLLGARSAATCKRVSLELGGNAPFIVFGDADVDAAVEGALASKFRNTGQTCVCTNRVLVHDDVYDEFASKLAARAARMRVGHGFADGVDQGPLINARGAEKVAEHVADATAKGAEVLAGGAALPAVDASGRDTLPGSFFAPTVLAGADASMAVAAEETFGPVAPLFRFSDEEEAVAAANATDAGLAAYFYSRDVGRCWRVAEALEYGMVGVNEGVISTEVAPFGGVKESGMGREGGDVGADEYTEWKYICMGGVDA